MTIVELDGVTPVAAGMALPVLAKERFPRPAAGAGRRRRVIADKPEGLAITGDGELVGVVDNDGLDDAPGESVLLRLER